jgi:aspartate racemase
MLSIIDALVDAARAGGIRRPGLVATRPTTEGEFFARPFEAAGIELVRPDEADRAFVHGVYFGELIKKAASPTRPGRAWSTSSSG